MRKVRKSLLICPTPAEDDAELSVDICDATRNTNVVGKLATQSKKTKISNSALQ